MGFKEVIDYVPGKQGWFDENRPREGQSAEELWIGDVAANHVPTCALKETIGAVRDRLRESGQEACLVVNGQGIVLGMLREQALRGDPEKTAEEVMDPGPKTFRPSVEVEQVLEWMRRHDVRTFAPVTTLEGRLVGAISRADAEATFSHDHDHEHGQANVS